MNLEDMDSHGAGALPPATWNPRLTQSEDAAFRRVHEILAERTRNQARWGEQNYPSIVPISRGANACRLHAIPTESDAKRRVEYHTREHTLTWTDVLLEEFAEAVAAPDETHRRAELVQVAAVALAWIECIDRRAATQREVTP